jgi:hypothetical protein
LTGFLWRPLPIRLILNLVFTIGQIADKHIRLFTRSYYRLIIQDEYNTYKINTQIKLGGENPLIILLLDQLRVHCNSEKIEGITCLLKI